jgi:hypothetical protein
LETNGVKTGNICLRSELFDHSQMFWVFRIPFFEQGRHKTGSVLSLSLKNMLSYT